MWGSLGPCDHQPMARTVLIVDDHAPFRAVARALLQLEGFAVVGEAADALSALEAVGRLRPDVVVLDIQLPDLDGFEVARRLAQAGTSVQPDAVAQEDGGKVDHELVNSWSDRWVRTNTAQSRPRRRPRIRERCVRTPTNVL
jgi:CheY-like chemotaxis protein